MNTEATIEGLEQHIAGLIEGPLHALVAGHLGVKVTLRHPNGRKIKRTAPSRSWIPEDGDLIEIRFEPVAVAPLAAVVAQVATQLTAPPRYRTARPASPGNGSDARVDRLVQALARAEGSPTRRFVALTWFRDQALAQEGIYQPEARDLLNSALRAGMVLTRKEANPHRPEFPVTALYLDRNHPGVQSALRQAERRFGFQPVEVRGEPVSASLLRDRR